MWAEVVSNVEAKTLLPLLCQCVKAGLVVFSDTFTSYTGVAASGYIHRLVDHSQAIRGAHGKTSHPVVPHMLSHLQHQALSLHV